MTTNDDRKEDRIEMFVPRKENETKLAIRQHAIYIIYMGEKEK
jgi:hypothetical protein